MTKPHPLPSRTWVLLLQIFFKHNWSMKKLKWGISMDTLVKLRSIVDGTGIPILRRLGKWIHSPIDKVWKFHIIIHLKQYKNNLQKILCILWYGNNKANLGYSQANWVSWKYIYISQKHQLTKYIFVWKLDNLIDMSFCCKNEQFNWYEPQLL